MNPCEATDPFALTEASKYRPTEIPAMPHSLKVAAVFATMNRRATAEACVAALARQTRPPDLVVVADNCSDDGTASTLENLTALPFPLRIVRMAQNRGNAGGVQEAMDLAFAEGADAVWILDDDSWPRPDALGQLLAGRWDATVVRHPLQIDPATGKFTWPLQVRCDGEWKLIWQESELPPDDPIVTRICWTGAVVSREVRDKVGPVNGDLFIRGEDEEYPWRIEQAGFSQIAMRASVMDHPGPQDVVYLRFMGKSFFFERGLADWKLYYKVRNMVWLKKRQAGPLRAIAMAAAYSIAALLIDGTHRIPLLRRAISDGWRGRLGKM